MTDLNPGAGHGETVENGADTDLVHRDHRGGLDLGEDVGDGGGPQLGVQRHRHHAPHEQAELRYDPLRTVPKLEP